MKKLSILFLFFSFAFAGDRDTGNKNTFTVTYLMLEKAHIALPSEQKYEEHNVSNNQITYNGGAAEKK